MKIIKLIDVCEKIGSGATPRGGSEVYLSQGGIALIRSQNVYNDGFKKDGLAYITEIHAKELESVSVERDDILLNITGDSVARCCQVPNELIPARVNQHVAIIRPDKEKLDPRYLRYWLIEPTMQEYMFMMASGGATRNALTKGMIESFEISAPPLPEQRAIAGILGALDDKIELNHRMNATLEAMARAVFREWFVESEEVEGWEEKQLEEITVKITKGTTPTTLGKNFVESGINFIKVNSITDDHHFLVDSFDFIDEETHDLLSRSVIEKDDILLTIAGTIGRVAKVPDYILPANTNQAVAIIRPDKSKVLPNYIRMWLCLDDVRQELFANVVHAVQANLSLGMISKTKIRLPKYARLKSLFEPIDLLLNQVEHNEKESRTLASLRDSLLPKLMRGEVRVDNRS